MLRADFYEMCAMLLIVKLHFSTYIYFHSCNNQDGSNRLAVSHKSVETHYLKRGMVLEHTICIKDDW